MFCRKLILWIFPLLLLTGGCAGDRIQLFNYDIGTFFGSKPTHVVVRKGDTLYSIARRYDVPIREMIETNNLRPPYTLTIGQRLLLPSAKYHIVQKGDTVYNISKRYNIDMSSLSKANNISAPYALRIGQRLTLPGSIVTKPVATNYVSNSAPKKTTSSWKPWAKKTTTTKTAQSRSYTPPAKKRTSKFAWPVRGTVISKFGTIGKGRTNDGINIKAPLGTAVKAADTGTVAYAGNELKGFGNLILIKHPDGWITAYAHNDRLTVKKGQKVKKGEKIATVGSTGGVNTPQLHFEIRSGKKAVNPQQYLSH